MNLPALTEPQPWECRAESLPVIVTTRSGDYLAARLFSYCDEDQAYAPRWELIGRDGLQLERDEVVSWFYPQQVGELLEAATEIAAHMPGTYGDRVRAAINQVKGEAP